MCALKDDSYSLGMGIAVNAYIQFLWTTLQRVPVTAGFFKPLGIRKKKQTISGQVNYLFFPGEKTVKIPWVNIAPRPHSK